MIITVEVEPSPNCDYHPQQVFEALEEPWRVSRVRVERPDGSYGWCLVTGWCSDEDGSACEAFCAKVGDSGSGFSFLVHGGDYGLRLMPSDHFRRMEPGRRRTVGVNRTCSWLTSPTWKRRSLSLRWVIRRVAMVNRLTTSKSAMALAVALLVFVSLSVYLYLELGQRSETLDATRNTLAASESTNAALLVEKARRRLA